MNPIFEYLIAFCAAFGIDLFDAVKLVITKWLIIHQKFITPIITLIIFSNYIFIREWLKARNELNASKKVNPEARNLTLQLISRLQDLITEWETNMNRTGSEAVQFLPHNLEMCKFLNDLESKAPSVYNLDEKDFKILDDFIRITKNFVCISYNPMKGKLIKDDKLPNLKKFKNFAESKLN